MKSYKKSTNIFIKAMFAMLVGLVNGFFGGGGGLLCVPTLEKVYKLDTKKSHATAIAIMFPLSVVSSCIYFINNNMNIYSTISVAIGSVLGGIIGAFALKKFNNSIIRWIFIIVLFSAGVRMVV